MLSLKCPFTDKGEYYMAYLRPSAHKALHPDQLKYVFDSKTLEVKDLFILYPLLYFIRKLNI